MGLDRSDGYGMLSAQQSNGLAQPDISPHHVIYPLGHGTGAGHVGFNCTGGMDPNLRDIHFKLEVVIFKTIGRRDHGFRSVPRAAPKGGRAVIGDWDQGHLGGFKGRLFRRQGEEVMRNQRIQRGRPGFKHGFGPVPRLRGRRAVVAPRPAPGAHPAILSHAAVARS